MSWFFLASDLYFPPPEPGQIFCERDRRDSGGLAFHPKYLRCSQLCQQDRTLPKPRDDTHSCREISRNFGASSNTSANSNNDIAFGDAAIDTSLNRRTESLKPYFPVRLLPRFANRREVPRSPARPLARSPARVRVLSALNPSGECQVFRCLWNSFFG